MFQRLCYIIVMNACTLSAVNICSPGERVRHNTNIRICRWKRIIVALPVFQRNEHDKIQLCEMPICPLHE